jgi:hypothetical protein
MASPKRLLPSLLEKAMSDSGSGRLWTLFGGSVLEAAGWGRLSCENVACASPPTSIVQVDRDLHDEQALVRAHAARRRISSHDMCWTTAPWVSWGALISLARQKGPFRALLIKLLIARLIGAAGRGRRGLSSSPLCPSAPKLSILLSCGESRQISRVGGAPQIALGGIAPDGVLSYVISTDGTVFRAARAAG